MASTITYEVRVLRHVLESCDWLASRGRDGLAKLKEMARETKWHDGDARPERVALPEIAECHAALGVRFENCNYAGIVTRMLQPILPIFFAVQFNFLYDGYKNEFGLDLKSGLPLFILGVFILAVGAGAVGEGGILLGGFGLDALLSGEAFAAVSDAAASILDIGGL